MSVIAAPTYSKPKCERTVIRTADGRVFDLGYPDSIFFKLRVFIYKLRRWKEFKNG